ncbi:MULTISPECIES: Tat pathway signal sequence domain protein [Kitasatospora]|uniref:Tat pathway signal sequence domain protein n=1 Tax=Kitasatospora cathayae TaxID=3004092 RepID=A0ABY7QEJ8_9ACTN|nr:Tat pathway signal sequence domain protein [Kitasatospora sp. HUAS 3-15]WBP90516.1 Tat pathway signal sequence domain protein [Kitasatospora sp. HUAS 3-15]
MRIRRTLAAASLAAIALTGAAVAPAQADAAAVMTQGSASGPAIAVGDTLVANLASGTAATFTDGPGSTNGVSCANSSFSATVTSNPAAPGSATEQLNSQSFDSCTSSVMGVMSVQSVTATSLPYTNTVTSGSGNVSLNGTSAGPVGITVVLNTLLGTINCVYQSPNGITGTTSNSNSSISFTDQPATLVDGPGLCFSTGYFSATYGPVTDSSAAGNPVLYVN